MDTQFDRSPIKTMSEIGKLEHKNFICKFRLRKAGLISSDDELVLDLILHPSKLTAAIDKFKSNSPCRPCPPETLQMKTSSCRRKADKFAYEVKPKKKIKLCKNPNSLPLRTDKPALTKRDDLFRRTRRSRQHSNDQDRVAVNKDHCKERKALVLGQRSIPSSFISRSSNPARDSKQDGQKEDSKKKSCVSFTDFLDKKLHKNTVLPKILKGKSRPFWSPLGPSNVGGPTDHQIGVQKEEQEKSSVLDQLVFEQFKPTGAEKGDDLVSIGDGERGDGMGPFGAKVISSSSFLIGSSGDGGKGTSTTSFGIGSSHVGEVGTSAVNDSRKRRNPFRGNRQFWEVVQIPIKKEEKRASQATKNKGLSTIILVALLLLTDANGSGWWDCDMEGVDSEEVGFGEIWEGSGTRHVQPNHVSSLNVKLLTGPLNYFKSLITNPFVP
ncbi:unnamed protein product [Dovyalis caffra]|uniref:Uncharacterized protein n=1 Tax=Dovyalis caffra TaxID=77055 RepID=A0AAV1RJ58_9ROSI|nr:unnamed protein product [Dovyalis caffra]